MQCRLCGTELPREAAFCPTCGSVTPYNVSRAGVAPHDLTVASSPPGAPSAPPPAANSSSPPYRVPSQNPFEPFNPYQAPLPPPLSPRPSLARLTALLVGFVLLLIGGSGLIYYTTVYQPHLQQTQATATAAVQLTGTASAFATTQAKIHATATAAAENPYTHSGTLALSDPLNDNGKGLRWDEATVSDGSFCQFVGGAYHANQTNPSYLHQCVAEATNFSDFTFEVQMKIIKGGGGGILFCADNATGKWYNLSISQGGDYILVRFDGYGLTAKTLRSGSLSVMKTGLNQTNLIAVVAKRSTFDLYVNHQKIDSVSDNSYSHGQIGVLASYAPAEVVYSNAKVWTF